MAARIETSSTEIARWNAQLEEQVEAKTKELEKVMAGKVQTERLSAMGYIAASVAHELNDPITAISGYTQLGLKEVSKPQTPEESPKALKNASDYFKYIEKELQRSKTSIRKLLSFVRHSKTGEGPVDINQVLNDTLTIAGHHLEINKVELLTRLEPELPLVTGNDQQYQQAFLNMVLFAQKSMPRGGKLVVETRRNGMGNKSGVEILIAGSGSSISQSNPESIFEPSSPESLTGEGIELDLSVSHDIITQYGGKIGVKSETGIGTKFIISLPPANNTPSGNSPAK
jgi:signal transduction histidine kinase